MMPVNPTQPAQNDPYAEFGGSIVAAPAPASTASSSASSDPYAEFGGGLTPEFKSVVPTVQTGDSVAKHGLLSRAWDWVNTPIFDNVLPTGVKTADIVKAAAFEKMYGQAYIPGVNDFETKAQLHLGDSPTKAGIRTFINGVAADTANMASSFTSPVGVATIAAGVPELEAGSTAAKAALATRTLAGTAFGLKGAGDIYAAGTENTPEAWQQRLQGAAQIVGGSASLAEPVSELSSTARSAASPKIEQTVGAVKNIVKGGQPKLQAAIRDAAEAGAAKADALGSHPDILDKQVEAEPEDEYPVKLVYDKDGNVADLDGRHRVIQAIDEGKEAIPVQVTLRDGTTATIQQDPKVVAEKFGVSKESLSATDEQQAAVRAGGGQPREPVLKPAAETSAAAPIETPVAPATKTGGIRTAIEDVSNDIKAKSQTLYQRLDNESGGRWQRYEDQIKNLDDKMDEVNGIDDESYDRLETKRNDIETSQAQMLEDLKEKGIDPKIAEDAVSHYKQAMALKDLDRAVKSSTLGEARIGGKEVVNPKVFTNRVQKLYDSGRLGQALGKEGADALLKEAYAAKTAKSVQTLGKWTAGILAARYAGGSVLHNIVTAATMAP